MVERVPDKNEVHGSIPCAPTMPQLKEVLGEQMVQQLKRLAIQVDANKWQPSIFQGPVWFELLAKHNGNEGSARQELAEIFSKVLPIFLCRTVFSYKKNRLFEPVKGRKNL